MVCGCLLDILNRKRAKYSNSSGSQLSNALLRVLLPSTVNVKMTKWGIWAT